MITNWQQSLALVLKSEDGFSNNPADNGNWLSDGRKGCTMLGITQTTWESWVGRQSDEKEMRGLTPEKVAPLYKRKYWDVCRCDDLPSSVDYLVFDFAVNAGVGRSVKTLQSAVGATMDGVIGPLTLAAVKNTPDLIDKFSQAKIEFYKSLNNPTFEEGWLNRVEHVKTDAKAMAKD